jgi:hypothetical protein
MLRTRNISRHGLEGFNKRCMVCEQFVCTFWNRICSYRVEWLTREKAKEKLATMTPQPHLRRRLSEDSIERLIHVPLPPTLPPPLICQPPNPDMSNITAQLAQKRSSIYPFQPRIATKGTLPEYCRWDETNVHTCCTPAGSCKLAVQILSPVCRHVISQDCLRQWVIAGKNWCRFCGVVWFKKRRTRLRGWCF